MVGSKIWSIAEGYIPITPNEHDRRFISHETACILNTNESDAHVKIMIYFSDQEPVGPYKVTIPAKRTYHLRFNDLKDPKPIPRETDYSSVFESDIPVVIQHTRLDTRRPALALLSTIAFSQS